MSKYIDADKLTKAIEDKGLDCSFALKMERLDTLALIDELQQEQPKKSIEINGIRYKEVPAKTDDKICKDCDYFLDNGSCNLDACPCACDVNILERIQQEQPDNEEIDKVAQELYEHLYELKRRNNVPTNLYDKQEIIALWKAGIEYAYNHPKQEQPMPDSTKLIELWHEDKEMLKGKDFRDDPWRLAYNAFMCGFGRGITVNKQEQPEQTCKTCGFYENNCPFIRGKLIPYPNKVCNDYTYSAMKEHPEGDLEKAAQHVYESWMGSTMDDVRRDMVELGKVLNARKEI